MSVVDYSLVLQRAFGDIADEHIKWKEFAEQADSVADKQYMLGQAQGLRRALQIVTYNLTGEMPYEH